MVGAAALDQLVNRHASAALQNALQAAFRVQMILGGAGGIDVRADGALDQRVGRVPAAVQIHRADHGLHHVAQDGRLFPPAGALLAHRKPDALRQPQPPRRL